MTPGTIPSRHLYQVLVDDRDAPGGRLVLEIGYDQAESVAALSFINVVLVAIGLTVALRFGVKLHD